MTKYYPEFFNDVFGPIMQPGSSSHTAGPCRIGNLAHQLLQSDLKEITVELDSNGSFAGTFGHMNEDLGMLAGAYGLLPDDERMFSIKDILKQQGIKYSFKYTDFPKGSHPNAVRFILKDINNKVVSLTGNSTGGGMIETVEIMGIEYSFVGDSYLTCVSFNDDISKFAVDAFEVKQGSQTNIFFLHSEKPLEINDALVLFNLKPIVPVTAVKNREEQLFKTFDEWISLAKDNNISLADVAILYEQNASGWSKDRIIGYMKNIRKYMEKQTETVYIDNTDLLETPYSGYHYAGWHKYETANTPISGVVTALAIHYAFGVQALIKGVKLVPGPMGTGGGYLYSALRAVKEIYNYSDDEVIDALFVAAGVGAICYTRTNPTGEMLGCTGECGVCGAMAAAAITYMVGGTPEQVEAAASMMFQAALGWPCDPIPGGYNQPCMSRVLTAVIMSITFADIALSGRKAVVPFHEVVDEADLLGKQMPSTLKCTSCGGLCETPSGKKCKADFEKWHKNQS
ncbi:MAG: L-serine ammonia-lyase, iron-sulfur-dependent, subunit alpha [Faecalibacterium sp.]|nr:L-serine ammonia-lyase, iron-sulfur-dependent, subunit alpha [Ruminococcus sp.]MCM1392311.1 L-serine ammonia-lyase, iron-sulfur-dependent, subunit alpha [Ruminococcus sp.]MCM1484723.1 L-serine ammonia-lyase, iron-sulfur-dependent, subunit alpha [Faecalibacterium sp.]